MVQRLSHPFAAALPWAHLHGALHRWRLQHVHARVAQRRASLEHWLDGVDAATFERNGFLVKRQVLPHAQFEALCEQVLSQRRPAHEMLQGDTVTRHIAIAPALLQAAPALATLLRGRLWNGLTRYVAAADHAPAAFVQTLVTHARPMVRDPQTLLHADGPRPMMKAWFFLNDVGEEDAPLCYVPGSHRLTAPRLDWEVQQAEDATARGGPVAASGLHRIDKHELGALGLGHPARLVVPANTLIVADTFGFHKRAQARRPTMRVELWAGGWRHQGEPEGPVRHLMRQLGWANGGPDPWHARGPLPPGVLPHWRPQDAACDDARHGAY
ncbi:MAG TPA: phytanoyl-CoA dioxygenase family protein [Ideonella sp.]|uniref:phytanoyl-CoA dioxygenase family protein n=1 Tax=Ideonella sp. TaxID=1929293 RepID=UPI002E2F4D8D|nr:phytanoyl-CoA dioxygenase family protein [Ideonella sp.]HEX5687902.1 phytanoyl-CoA dioxygenase family protein [Ideonella sp.]